MAKRENPFKTKAMLYPIAGGKLDDTILRMRPYPEASNIQQRKWIYERDLVRGFVTVMAAPGGTGKSTLVLAMLLSIAIGRPLLQGAKVHQRCNIMLCALEDPDEELSRREAGMCQRFNITKAEYHGHVFSHAIDRRLHMGAYADDNTIAFDDFDALVDAIKTNDIGVVCVDPFSETHELSENSNGEMVEVIMAWRRVARAANCAVLLVHHVRKAGGDGVSGVRGAVALTDGARVALTVSAMAEQDAKAMDIPEDDRWTYLRLDTGKANMAPRHKARWFHITTHDIGNGQPGDSVPVIEVWKPPSVWEHFTVADQHVVLDMINRAWADGEPYSDTKRGKDRWVGYLLARQLDISEDQAVQLIRAWMKSKLLVADTFTNRDSKPRNGLRVDDSKRPGPAQ